MDWWLALAVFLYLLCGILIVVEIFVPSGGLISICALACLAGGIWLFFENQTIPIWIGIVIACIEIPISVIVSWKLLSLSSFGKSVMLQSQPNTPGEAIADTELLQEMHGKIGKVITPLRPVGTVDFDGKRLECVAESGYVDKGSKVEVIKIESTQLTVRLMTNK